MRQGHPRNTKHMGLAKENRNESFKKVNKKTRQLEILNLIQETGPITPNQLIQRGLQGDRPLSEVQPRFNELWKKGHLIIIGSFYNQKSDNLNCIYRISTDDEKKDYTRKAGQEWTDRIKRLEADSMFDLSEDTREWIKKEIVNLKKNIKNLIKI